MSECPVQADASIGGRQAQHVRDLTIAEILVEAQFDDLPMVGVENVQGGANGVPHFVGHGLFLRSRRSSRDLFGKPGSRQQGIALELFPDGPKTAEALPNQPSDDAAQEGAEGMLLAPLAQDKELVAPQVDVDLLSEIVESGFGSRGGRPDDGTEERIVATDEALRCPPRAGHEGGDQDRIFLKGFLDPGARQSSLWTRK
jgi:hypothetical protein